MWRFHPLLETRTYQFGQTNIPTQMYRAPVFTSVKSICERCNVSPDTRVRHYNRNIDTKVNIHEEAPRLHISYSLNFQDAISNVDHTGNLLLGASRLLTGDINAHWTSIPVSTNSKAELDYHR